MTEPEPKWLSDLTAALAEITDETTTGIALIASSGEEIRVRTFGDTETLAADVRTAAEVLRPN